MPHSKKRIAQRAAAGWLIVLLACPFLAAKLMERLSLWYVFPVGLSCIVGMIVAVAGIASAAEEAEKRNDVD